MNDFDHFFQKQIVEEGRISQDKEFNKRIVAFRQKHGIEIDEDLWEKESKIPEGKEENKPRAEKSQSETTEKFAKNLPTEKKEESPGPALTKNQKRNLKKRKLKKKKQAAKRAEIEKEDQSQDEDQEKEENESKALPEERPNTAKKREDLSIEEAFDNLEKELGTSKAKDSTKIHFDK